MKNLRAHLLASVSAAGLMVTTAVAADMPYPVKASAMVAPTPMTWAGPYVGINLGAARHKAEFWDLGSEFGPYAFFVDSKFWTPTKTGFTIGGQAGYNWQAGNFVYGLEGDLNWIDGKTTQNFNVAAPLLATSKLEWMSTLRGRVGWAFSPVLVYATGGFAAAHISNSFAFTDPLFHRAAGPSTNKTRTGWTAGGGIEYMFAPNWTARVEGLYADFGSVNDVFTSGGHYQSRFTDKVAIIRGGLNWKW